MTTPAHPARMLFVSIPIADLERSTAFVAKLGFSYNPAFTDDTAACMPVGEQAFVMLLRHETFAQISKLPMADPTHARAFSPQPPSPRVVLAGARPVARPARGSGAAA